MKKFIMFGDYCENVEEKRQPFREAHLSHLKELKKAGMLEKAGPTRNLKKIFAIFVHDNRDEIIAEIEKDAYWINGIWTSYDLEEWIDAI